MQSAASPSRLIGPSGPGLLGSSFRASTCHHPRRSCRPGSSATPSTTGKLLRHQEPAGLELLRKQAKNFRKCLASCSMLCKIVRPDRRNCSRQRDAAARIKSDGQPPLLHCRTNYALIIVAALGVALLRNPGALVACGVCLAAALCLNDTFATTLRCCEVLPRWTCCIATSPAT